MISQLLVKSNGFEDCASKIVDGCRAAPRWGAVNQGEGRVRGWRVFFSFFLIEWIDVCVGGGCSVADVL